MDLHEVSAEGWRQVPIRGDATHADQSSDLVVVCVTGLTPQIVTETVFALAQRPQGLPREIHILTTVTGKQLAMSAAIQHKSATSTVTLRQMSLGTWTVATK